MEKTSGQLRKCYSILLMQKEFLPTVVFALPGKKPFHLPGFDENDYADNSKAKKRDWNDMIEELKAVRRSTEILFSSFDKEQLSTVGTSNNNPVSVLAIGFIIVGHINHHIKITKGKILVTKKPLAINKGLSVLYFLLIKILS